MVVAILSAFPEVNWTAAKITQYGPGVCPIKDEGCGCANDEHTFVVTEEREPEGEGDTCRFLAAGATRAFWVRTKRGRLADAMPALRTLLAQAGSVIIESNSLLEFVRPTLYLVVLDPRREDFKASSGEFLDRADAFLLCSPLPGPSPWQQTRMEVFSSKPTFLLEEGRFFSAQVRDFVAARFLDASDP